MQDVRMFLKYECSKQPRLINSLQCWFKHKLFLKYILDKALRVKLKVSSKFILMCDPANMALLLANFNF